MKIFLLCTILLCSCLSKSVNVQEPPPKITLLLKIFTTKSFANIRNYIVSNGFKLKQKDTGDTSRNAIHTYYYSKNTLDFWINIKSRKLDGMSYYPSNQEDMS